MAVLDEHDIDHNISPRYQACPKHDAIMFKDAEGNYLAPNGTMCLKFIDTDQEKKIDLGVSWPYEALEPYECLISDDFASSGGVKVGDYVSITLIWDNFFNGLRVPYNNAAQANGW